MSDTFQEIDRHDSRYDAKQKDIKATVDRMVAQQKQKQRDWESNFAGELEEATMGAVLKGGVNCVGGRAAYRTNYDKWIRSLKDA